MLKPWTAFGLTVPLFSLELPRSSTVLLAYFCAVFLFNPIFFSSQHEPIVTR